MVERDIMSTSNDSLTERVHASFKRLSSASVQLNTVSDELGKLIAELDAMLKALNLGVEGWVCVWGGEAPDGDSYFSYDLGYTKVTGKWGIALRHAEGRHSLPDWGSEDIKPFNEGRRDLRVAAIDKIPDLLEKLGAEAEATSHKTISELSKVQEFIVAISEANRQAAPRK